MRSFSLMLAACAGLIGIGAIAQKPLATPPQPLGPVQAASAAPAASPAPVPVGGATLTAADANAWLDGYIPYALSAGDIAGAVVVIVKDGQVLTQRGYGYADIASRKPVDPERTLFR